MDYVSVVDSAWNDPRQPKFHRFGSLRVRVTAKGHQVRKLKWLYQLIGRCRPHLVKILQRDE